MNKIILLLLAIAAAAAAVWFFFFRAKPAAKNPAATNTATAKAPATYQNLWGFANAATLKNTSDTVVSVFGDLKSLSNIFGSNDGGAKPGVAVSGSNTGGTQSSGSGAGVAVDSSQNIIPDSWFDGNFSDLVYDSPQTA